jgi:hypothetical protein
MKLAAAGLDFENPQNYFSEELDETYSQAGKQGSTASGGRAAEDRGVTAAYTSQPAIPSLGMEGDQGGGPGG